MARIENNFLKSVVEANAREALKVVTNLKSEITTEREQKDCKDPDGYMYGFPIFSDEYDSSSIDYLSDDDDDDDDDDNSFPKEESYYRDSDYDKPCITVPKREIRRRATKLHKAHLTELKAMVYKDEYLELRAKQEREFKDSQTSDEETEDTETEDTDEESDKKTNIDVADDSGINESYDIAKIEWFDGLYMRDYVYENSSIVAEVEPEPLDEVNNKEDYNSEIFVKLKCWRIPKSKTHFDRRIRNSKKSIRVRNNKIATEDCEYRLRYVGKSFKEQERAEIFETELANLRVIARENPKMLIQQAITYHVLDDFLATLAEEISKKVVY